MRMSRSGKYPPCAVSKREREKEKESERERETERDQPLETNVETGATGWPRLIGSPKMQIIFRERATKHRSLLRKMA